MKLYNRLLLKLIELRTLHEMHSSILLDADPTQLEPFPLALIMNEKEEAERLKALSNQGEANPQGTGATESATPVPETESRNMPTNETGNSSSSPSESEPNTPPIQSMSSSYTPPTSIVNSITSSSSGGANKQDSFSSILTPSSSGGYSNGGQISTVSSPSTAQESPLMIDVSNSGS